MNVSSIGLSALRRAEEKLEKGAREVTRVTAGVAAEGGAEDGVSLSDSMAGLLEAQRIYEANLKLISDEDDLTKHTIDLIG